MEDTKWWPFYSDYSKAEKKKIIAKLIEDITFLQDSYSLQEQKTDMAETDYQYESNIASNNETKISKLLSELQIFLGKHQDLIQYFTNEDGDSLKIMVEPVKIPEIISMVEKDLQQVRLYFQ